MRFRARPELRALPIRLRAPSQRSITSDEKPLPTADVGKIGPNMEQLPHVSEEQAALDKIMGETAPQIEEQGTPVQDVGKSPELGTSDSGQLTRAGRF